MTSADHAADARRVFDATADKYVTFAGTELSDKTEGEVDRSALAAFVQVATERRPRRPFADLGCGPGRIAAFLARSGLEPIGIDVSARLARLAREAHPTIPFAAGQISTLPLADRSLDGAVCWFSIIYTPPDRLDGAFREIARVLVPGAPLLLAFQAGPARPIERGDAFGSGHPLTSYRHDPAVVRERLRASAFAVEATTWRPPLRDHEDSPQAFVLARR